MTTINTTDDLIEVLKGDDKVRSAVRRELLTDELLALPERFGKMVETQTAMLETQTAMLETQTAILDDLKSLREEQKALREDTDSLLETQNSLLETQTAMLENIGKMRGMQEDDRQAMHRFRGNYAVDAVTKNKVGIAEHFSRLRQMRQIKCEVFAPAALDDMLDRSDNAQALSGFKDDELNHFNEADLAVGVKRRRGREPEFYIVVEASYTGTKSDVHRAVVRANILGAITGRDTYAVVAAVKLKDDVGDWVTRDVEEYMASDGGNAAFWYQIVEEDMEPPSPR